MRVAWHRMTRMARPDCAVMWDLPQIEQTRGDTHTYRVESYVYTMYLFTWLRPVIAVRAVTSYLLRVTKQIRSTLYAGIYVKLYFLIVTTRRIIEGIVQSSGIVPTNRSYFVNFWSIPQIRASSPGDTLHVAILCVQSSRYPVACVVAVRAVVPFE